MSDAKVEERARKLLKPHVFRVGQRRADLGGIRVESSAVDYWEAVHVVTDLLTKLDEAEKENAKLRGVNRALERRCLDAQGREVTLIAGVKEAICALDLVDVHQYELGSGSVGDIARTLSRLLPSTPTEEGKSHE